MKTSRNIIGIGGICLAWAGLAVAPAVAGDHCRQRRVDVDLDSLKAELRPVGPEQLALCVRYKVEIEHARPGDRFVLVLQLNECGRLLADPNGQPFQVVVPLDQPTDCHHDELKFKSGTEITLPAGMVHCPDRLKLQGVVFYEGSNAPLDHKSKSVSFKGGHCGGGWSSGPQIQIRAYGSW